MSSNYFSKLKGAIWIGIQRSIYVKESAVDVLIGQGKLSLSSSRLLHSLPSETFTDLLAIVRPGTLAAVQANLHVVNRKKNISVVGAFSRAISLPSVTGSSFQVCGYQVDCLLSETSSDLRTNSRKSIMSVCGSRSALANYSFTNLTSGPAQAGLAARCSFSKSSRRNFDCYRRVSMSFSDKYQPSKFLFYGFFVYNAAKQKGNGIPLPGLDFEGLHTLPPPCSPAGTASDVSFQNTETYEPNSSSSDSNEPNIANDRILKLTSGSCYLPHPQKEDTGGEDAHFICTEEHAIGVADGVGGWADLGVNAGIYARELMSNSVNAIQEEPKRCIDPARVLEKAYTSTNANGSSTACIIALTDEGLHAVNLGDSGFMVVRNGCTVFRSPVQQHDFNLPYQLERDNAGDLPSSGDVFTIPVAPGDVIIAGTDGLFDNLYNHDITAVVVHALRANLGPQVTAQKIAALARQRAMDKNRQTPFSTAAQEAGVRYYGGKLDDITVVVSYITSDHNENLSSKSSQ